MPVSSFTRAILKKKEYKLLAFLLLSPLFFYGQSLTGLWIGTLSNDSTTIRKDQSFEIALTEYKGKVYGYSRSEFVVNDTLFYIVKRVKGTIEGDVCEVTDDEIISYNFRGKLDKGIKVTSTFRRNQTDSVWQLDGNWKTNATKKYYAVTGKVGLAEEKDLTASKIFPHLEELNLANDVAFYKERVESIPVVKVVKPERNYQLFKEPNSIGAVTSTGIAAAQPELSRAESDYVKPLTTPEKNQPAFKEPGSIPATVSTGIAASQPELYRAESDYVKPLTTPEKMQAGASSAIAENDLAVTKPQVSKPKTELAKTEAPIVSDKKDIAVKPSFVKETGTNARQLPTYKQTTASTKTTTTQLAASTAAAKTKPVVTSQPKQNNNDKPESTPTTATKKTDIAVSPEKTNAGITGASVEKPEAKKPLADVTLNAATISGRKSEFSQAVNFKSDSLVIALYDNGEIDGDTVSVYMNGQVIMSRQGLKASAIRKTIYITSGNEDFSLVLFADNLGKYPPNTGLLVVYDGDDIYNLRFSSDFQKNAGIVFRRKR